MPSCWTSLKTGRGLRQCFGWDIFRPFQTWTEGAPRCLAQSMETSEPVLELPDGTVLVGRFEETVGTQLIFGDEVMTDGSHQVQLVCHTDKRIVFTKLQPQPPAVGWAQQQTETPQMPQEAS